MGQGVIPDMLIEARKQGLSLAEIHERALAGEYAPTGGPPNPALII